MTAETGGTIEAAQFRNWVVKAKDSTGKIHELKLAFTSGVTSVPSTYKDINGRNWHNTTFGCGPKLDLNGELKLYLVPQLQDDGTSELIFSFSSTK